MPHELYDEQDHADHPVLVVANDGLRRRAIVITRTSTFRPERKNEMVAHPPSADLALERPGWWDPFRRYPVPWSHFEDSAVDFAGLLEERVWLRVQEMLRARKESS
ncbi:hypothetical protein [Aeromicrobium terrae]|uniref:Type II toxin-antitoxin system PemK/MazF family toxin n=1 Tax=Aeromicrobium terrae TaxID=2498846 RepID=A0A5C8NMQ4_9ACTN|nr:hypothetical protein [Aeromicrobium terrae]TXL62357.1 hypothetical protein FHP06_06610 [Aeromicrobium terrae]